VGEVEDLACGLAKADRLQLPPHTAELGFKGIGHFGLRNAVEGCMTGFSPSRKFPTLKKNGAPNTRPLQRPPPRGTAKQHPARRPLRGVVQGTAFADTRAEAQVGGFSGSSSLSRNKLFPGKALRPRLVSRSFSLVIGRRHSDRHGADRSIRHFTPGETLPLDAGKGFSSYGRTIKRTRSLCLVPMLCLN
jgi:hypothetical protein